MTQASAIVITGNMKVSSTISSGGMVMSNPNLKAVPMVTALMWIILTAPYNQRWVSLESW